MDRLEVLLDQDFVGSETAAWADFDGNADLDVFFGCVAYRSRGFARVSLLERVQRGAISFNPFQRDCYGEQAPRFGAIDVGRIEGSRTSVVGCGVSGDLWAFEPYVGLPLTDGAPRVFRLAASGKTIACTLILERLDGRRGKGAFEAILGDQKPRIWDVRGQFGVGWTDCIFSLLPRWVSCGFPVGTASGSRVASAVLLCLSLRCWAGQVLLDSCQFSSQVSELTLSSRVRGLTQPVVVEREVLDC